MRSTAQENTRIINNKLEQYTLALRLSKMYDILERIRSKRKHERRKWPTKETNEIYFLSFYCSRSDGFCSSLECADIKVCGMQQDKANQIKFLMMS